VDYINLENLNGVALVRLCRGTTNPIDLKLVNELSETLRQTREDSEILGVVLTGSNDKFFSIGFDIPGLYDLSIEDFTKFFSGFNSLSLDLYTHPKPVVAAVTGHATAGGCILALCCDYRFIAEGRKLMGLNEIRLGVPIPYPAYRILDQLVGFRNAREIIDSGRFFIPGESKELGMVDEILPAGAVEDSAIEKALSLSMAAPGAFALMKQDRTEKTAAEIRACTPEKESLFLECWYSSTARERLKEAMEKF